MFIWESGELNSEQELAIKEAESVLLTACPGSGKTRTLTYKIAYELSKLTSSKEYIIAITYTNNAADEIKERVELLGVDTKQLWIGTIHSFCLEWILRPYHLYLDELKNGFRVINSHESEAMFTELCKSYRKSKITYWDCGILAKPDGFCLTCLDKSKYRDLNEIIVKYFDALRQNNQIDFEQILFYSYQLLLEQPIIGSILCKLFPFILIDEYQDTKEIQYHIIAKILSANKGKSKTLIVGDSNQSIYHSLGGFPMPKNELEKLLGFNLIEMELTKNYRSSEKIINYFNFYRTFSNSTIPEGINREYPSKITFNDTISREELVDEIVKLIQYNVLDRGISTNEICIVAPQWVQLASITRSLMLKLPDYSYNGPGMVPFARDIDNFWFKLSRIILTEPSPVLYVKRLRWSTEILYELEGASVNLPYITNKSFLKLCNSIKIDDNDGLKFLEAFFNNILKELSIDLNLYPSLLEHYNSFFNSSKIRIEKLIKEGHEFIGDIKNFRKVFKPRDGITVSTIHGVKGEEYDTVIGFTLLEDYVPHFSDPNGKVNSKKLLYVLSSRARKNLHLISETGRKVHYYYSPNGVLPTSHLVEYKYEYDKL